MRRSASFRSPHAVTIVGSPQFYSCKSCGKVLDNTSGRFYRSSAPFSPSPVPGIYSSALYKLRPNSERSSKLRCWKPSLCSAPVSATKIRPCEISRLHHRVLLFDRRDGVSAEQEGHVQERNAHEAATEVAVRDDDNVAVVARRLFLSVVSAAQGLACQSARLPDIGI